MLTEAGMVKARAMSGNKSESEKSEGKNRHNDWKLAQMSSEGRSGSNLRQIPTDDQADEPA